MPKLYKCKTVIEYIALADDELDAQSLAGEVVRDLYEYVADENTTATLMTPTTPLPAGWIGDTLIYRQDDREPIPVVDAIRLYIAQNRNKEREGGYPKTCGKCGGQIKEPGPCPRCEDRPFGR